MAGLGRSPFRFRFLDRFLEKRILGISQILCLLDSYAILSTGFFHGITEALGAILEGNNLLVLLSFFGIISLFWFWTVGSLKELVAPSETAFWTGVSILGAVPLSVLLFRFNRALMPWGGSGMSVLENYTLFTHLFVLLPCTVIVSIGAGLKSLENSRRP